MRRMMRVRDTRGHQLSVSFKHIILENRVLVTGCSVWYRDGDEFPWEFMGHILHTVSVKDSNLMKSRYMRRKIAMGKAIVDVYGRSKATKEIVAEMNEAHESELEDARMHNAIAMAYQQMQT